MQLSRLYISDFMCYDVGFIDFTQFNTALVIGKVENNDHYSNGVGKSTIFKALEYVLFNQADINLEKIIRDDAKQCQLILDFMVDENEYRITRTRTRKGISDLSLFQRNSVDGLTEEVYHSESFKPITDTKYWKEISGRRAQDTDKELFKLIKINFKSFRIIVHFMQNDFSGLTTATPEKRKALLKDALSLLVYSKIEKIAKDKSMILSRESVKCHTILDNLGQPANEIENINLQLLNIDKLIQEKNILINTTKTEQNNLNLLIQSLTNQHQNLSNKFSTLLVQEQNLLTENTKINKSIQDISIKKAGIVKNARDLVEELKNLQEKNSLLSSKDFSILNSLNESILQKKSMIAENNVLIQYNLSKYEELKIPLPKDSICKNCRQKLTPEHRELCQEQINNDSKNCQTIINEYKTVNLKINEEINSLQLQINSLQNDQKQLQDTIKQILIKDEELINKRSLYDEYQILFTNANLEFADKTRALNSTQEELKNSSIKEASKLEKQIKIEQNNYTSLLYKLNLLSQELTQHLNQQAIFLYNKEQKSQDLIKKTDITKLIQEIDKKLSLYNKVSLAFSSSGIPNLIIQNVLEDLQNEANTLLNQLKPGLQLSFLVEKTKGDGSEADTLDIEYTVNSKFRFYEQLSGGQKLAVTFALKLGLSFLLQKMSGTDLKFLLLDEIDQSLDKSSINAFADMIKIIQKDFTVLIITHNDQLKDKFNHYILVEQDNNGVSKAKNVESN